MGATPDRSAMLDAPRRKSQPSALSSVEITHRQPAGIVFNNSTPTGNATVPIETAQRAATRKTNAQNKIIIISLHSLARAIGAGVKRTQLQFVLIAIAIARESANSPWREPA